jgi:hypothetical protein
MSDPLFLRRCWRCGCFVARDRWAALTHNWPEDEGITHEPECPPGKGCRR